MLAAVLAINPADTDFSSWAYNHFQDHLEIRGGIQTVNNINLPLREIDEINFDDLQSWFERHQLMHNEFNAVLKLQGNDLSIVDWRDLGQRTTWLWLNFREHFNARAALKI